MCTGNTAYQQNTNVYKTPSYFDKYIKTHLSKKTESTYFFVGSFHVNIFSQWGFEFLTTYQSVTNHHNYLWPKLSYAKLCSSKDKKHKIFLAVIQTWLFKGLLTAKMLNIAWIWSQIINYLFNKLQIAKFTAYLSSA